jgi:lysine 6-dehydrogenase
LIYLYFLLNNGLFQMGYTYAVIGAGRQGTAAAYDLMKYGDADKVILADKHLKQAQRAATRVNDLLFDERAEAKHVNVRNRISLAELLMGVDAFVSSVPYYFNLDISMIALDSGASMCDLGGNTEIVKRQLELDSKAKEAAITIVPDCGQVPGMGTTLCVYAMSLLDNQKEVFMWDGGLPQNPEPPYNYLLTFNVEGLTNEYAEPTFFLRNGELVEIQPLEELEEIEFPEPIGRLEAFTTGGGTSTAPWTFEYKLKTYQNKTVRYPGHYSQLKLFQDLGLFDLKPINADGVEVVPRDVFHALFEPRVTDPNEKDLVVIKVKCLGEKDGKETEVIVDLIDYYDDDTKFTAMERTTGWDASIVAIMMAHEKIKKGAIPVELAVDGSYFISELEKRGIEVQVSINEL